MTANMDAIVARVETKIDSHLADCTAYRQRHVEDMRDIKSDVKDVRMELSKQTKTLSFIIGGLIALSRVPDALTFIKHAIQ